MDTNRGGGSNRASSNLFPHLLGSHVIPELDGDRERHDRPRPFCSGQKRYLYRAIDQHRQVVDILLRDKRDRASAEAFFRRALSRTDLAPHTVVSDYHQPYSKAVASVVPHARHIRAGLHRVRGETTKPIERSHIPTRDCLRCSRGLKTLPTGQRFLECFEGFQALRRGSVKLCALVPGYQPTKVFLQETTRAVMRAVNLVGTHLKKAA